MHLQAPQIVDTQDRYRLSDLVDVPKLKELIELQHAMHPLPVSLVDLNRKEIIHVGRQEIFREFHTESAESWKLCQESIESLLDNLAEEKYKKVKCSLGLNNFAVPIFMDKVHVGSLIFSRFLLENEKIDRDEFENQAIRFGFPTRQYLEALDKIPIIPEKQVLDLIGYYKVLVESCIDTAPKELDNTMIELKNTNADLQQILEHSYNQQLLLAEANLAKDRLLSILAHDLKTPFNSILGLIGLLNDQFDDFSTADKKKYLKKVLETSNRTYELLENVLKWARSQSGKLKTRPAVLNVSELTDSSIDHLMSVAQKKKILIIKDIPDSISIKADKDMMQTVIRNLLSNAIKFTKKNGEIEIEAFMTDQEWVQINIKDDGIGIKKENIDKIFDIGQNYSTKGTENEAGTGMGLILCKEFVEKNKGTLNIQSTYNKGTEISIILPSPSKQS